MKTAFKFLRSPRSMALPTDPRASDLYLVEYPKSGVTWLSTIIANMALQKSGMTQQATFFNVSQYIPDIHMVRGCVGERIYVEPRFRIIKSHSEYNPNYQHVIYLVRHPEAVMRSYYTFLMQHGESVGTFDELLGSRKYGIPAWKKHINSWLMTNDQSSRLHLLRYEDLVEHPAKEMHLINDNLGLGFADHEIEQAIKLSSLSKMKESESLYSAKNPRYKLTFVKGERYELNPSQIAKVKAECVKELQLLGYE